MGRSMENKKIVVFFIFIVSLLSFSCDSGLYVSVINDTEYPVKIESDFREEVILPDNNIVVINFIGAMYPKHFNEENFILIVDIFKKKGYENGLYITYLETNYHVLTDEIVRLITYNSTFNQNVGAYIYTINLSEILESCKIKDER